MKAGACAAISVSSLDVPPLVEPTPDGLDETQRRFIRPLRNGEPVDWDASPDGYAVYQDGICGPEHVITVPSLASAIDFEACHRREVTLRLGLTVGR